MTMKKPLLIFTACALSYLALWSYQNIYRPIAVAAQPTITFKDGTLPTDEQRAEIYRQWHAQVVAQEAANRK